MRIREMVEADGAWAALLMADRRREYEAYSPVFWRRNTGEGVVESHGGFLGSVISKPETVAIRCDDGFAIATPHGAGYYVDDFAVGNGTWPEEGLALLSAIWSTIEQRAEFLRVVTAQRDAPKVELLLDVGLDLTERWWVKPVGQDSGSTRELVADGAAGFHVHQTAAPLVYDPGGPVGIVTGFTTAKALADAESAVEGTNIVLLIAPQAPGSAPEAFLEAAGFEVASEFYSGSPGLPILSGECGSSLP